MLKVNNKDTRTMQMASFWRFYKLWTYFTPCYSVSIVNFEQVNAGWDVSYQKPIPCAVHINPFCANGLFSYPLITPNRRFCCFQGYRMSPVTGWVKPAVKTNLLSSFRFNFRGAQFKFQCLYLTILDWSRIFHIFFNNLNFYPKCFGFCQRWCKLAF